MDFGFENIMDFAMNIDKLDLAILVRQVMDQNMENKTFLPKCKCTER